MQARYTDLLLLSKHQFVNPSTYDDLIDHLNDLNDLTPRIKVSVENPLTPEIAFGLDTRLWGNSSGSIDSEKKDWEGWGGEGRHEDEVEVCSVWRGRRKHTHTHVLGDGDGDGCVECDTEGRHVQSPRAGGEQGDMDAEDGPAVQREVLDAALAKLDFEIYRGKLYLQYLLIQADEEQSRESSVSQIHRLFQHTSLIGLLGDTI